MWSRADQLSLLQSAVALAGFGGAVVGLTFAGRAIAERYGRPRIIITMSDEPVQIFKADTTGDRMIGESAWFTFSIEVFNVGDAVANTWQLRVDVDEPFTLRVGEHFGEHAALPHGRSIVVHRVAPLFKDSPALIGPYRLTAAIPMFEDAITRFDFTIAAIFTSEFGEEEQEFPGTVAFDRTKSPKAQTA
jgi:hypothetical protein